jgi:hypothetical protein
VYRARVRIFSGGACSHNHTNCELTVLVPRQNVFLSVNRQDAIVQLVELIRNLEPKAPKSVARQGRHGHQRCAGWRASAAVLRAAIRFPDLCQAFGLILGLPSTLRHFVHFAQTRQGFVGETCSANGEMLELGFSTDTRYNERRVEFQL